ncbi:MAG: type II toxin-antitoxin system VapC family toxin [Thermodesulfobacteriota bacterium]
MRLLLDTHVFLWVVTGNERLSRKAVRAFLDSRNKIYLSAASLWEIGIKIGLGKLKLKDGWPKVFEKEMKINSIQLLPTEMAHCEQLARLPFHHRDPFDRMLISQAMVERMGIVSGDNRFSDYGIDRIW